jgi:hypothetical protein
VDLASFIANWKKNDGGEERANKDSFLNELCDVLGVPRPPPKTGDRERDAYVFEADVLHVNAGGKVSTLKVDLYKRDCFILEAKQGSNPGAPKKGCGLRESPAWHSAMASAKGQAVGYARSMDDPPPFIVVCDVGYMIELYADFDRTGNYTPFPSVMKSKIGLKEIGENVDTLRAVFLDPRSLDPAQAKVKVTREVAEHIAELARTLEQDGHGTELVAKFLMRCLFTMFAEDVDLLPDKVFTKAIEQRWLKDPKKFPAGVQALWQTMNRGGDLGLEGKILRFNGGLFTDPSALPLNKKGLELLLEAAKRDWSEVEPAIFGTLLERALNPKERHALGAHFTPRAYVERLVRPTIEEPVRREWENAQAAAHKLNADGKAEEARKVVHAFHEKLCQTRVLDPACGSGNFLYVTLSLFKQIESEVLAQLAALGEKQEQLLRVTPKQFHGIEKKRWAKEIAELVLWIGYLQWHYQTHERRVPPPEPVLQDFQNVECRDAVLAWDDVELVRDEKGKPVTRWDGETYKKSQITGEMVPDEAAQVQVERYTRPRKAEWPKTDYIVSNPPFLGTKRMRAVLGDGYVDALRSTYGDELEDNADYVMVWWHVAATAAEDGAVHRFGLITTNSLSQVFNRRLVDGHLERGLRICWAIPDHPWIDTATGADVRIAMTCCAKDDKFPAQLWHVVSEGATDDGVPNVSLRRDPAAGGQIWANLRMGPNVGSAGPLCSNADIAGMGVALHGAGFILTPEVAHRLRGQGDPTVVKLYLGGRDLVQARRERYLIDFSFLGEDEARTRHPAAFQHVMDRVLPERRLNRRESIRTLWWRFGWERPVLRKALAGLPRYVATTETARHVVFQFIPSEVLPDHKIVAVASADALVLGTLSSRCHVVWALAAGGRLGVGNDPVYNKTRCFDPFPFPKATLAQAERIRDLGEQLDAHRKARKAAHPDLTITGMYNVLEKLRANEQLTDKERDIHERGLVSILKKIHDDLDAAVFDAYGWPRDLTDEQILEKLVALNAERAEEEKRGLVRWLRPEFQNPTGKKPETQTTIVTEGEEAEAAPAAVQVKPWPKKLGEQLLAVRGVVAAPGEVFTVAGVAAAFKGAKKKDVEGILDGFASLGVLTGFETPEGRRWRAAGKG